MTFARASRLLGLLECGALACVLAVLLRLQFRPLHFDLPPGQVVVDGITILCAAAVAIRLRRGVLGLVICVAIQVLTIGWTLEVMNVILRINPLGFRLLPAAPFLAVMLLGGLQVLCRAAALVKARPTRSIRAA
jgi:hypothetical protein